jgi:hypothetical protein
MVSEPGLLLPALPGLAYYKGSAAAVASPNRQPRGQREMTPIHPLAAALAEMQKKHRQRLGIAPDECAEKSSGKGEKR